MNRWIDFEWIDKRIVSDEACMLKSTMMVKHTGEISWLSYNQSIECDNLFVDLYFIRYATCSQCNVTDNGSVDVKLGAFITKRAKLFCILCHVAPCRP